MTISIADTSRATLIFCDEATANLVREQLRLQSPGDDNAPAGVYVIALPEEDVPTPGDQESEEVYVPVPALLDAIRSSRR